MTPLYLFISYITTQLPSAINGVALSSFEKSPANGYWTNCSLAQGENITFEQCAQKCLDFGSHCGGFELWMPDDAAHCWIFTKAFNDLTEANCGPFEISLDCEKYDRITLPTAPEILYTYDSLTSSSWTNTGTDTGNDIIFPPSNVQITTPATSGDPTETVCFTNGSTGSDLAFINFDTNSAVNPELTMEIYVKQWTSRGEDWIIGHDDDAFDRAIIIRDDRFGGIAAGIGTIYTSNVSYLALNEWAHIIVTYSVSSNEATVYKNGGAAAGGEQQTMSIVDDSGSRFTRIGLNGLENFDAVRFVGCFSQISIRSSVLNANQVEDAYDDFLAWLHITPVPTTSAPTTASITSCSSTSLTDLDPIAQHYLFGDQISVNYWEGYTTMLMADGNTYSEFIVISPMPSSTLYDSYAEWNLAKTYANFTAVIGLALSTSTLCVESYDTYWGDSWIKVYVDSVLVHESLILTGDDFELINIDVSGVDVLRIQIIPGQTNECDHDVVANPMLWCTPTAAPSSATIPPSAAWLNITPAPTTSAPTTTIPTAHEPTTAIPITSVPKTSAPTTTAPSSVLTTVPSLDVEPTSNSIRATLLTILIILSILIPIILCCIIVLSCGFMKHKRQKDKVDENTLGPLAIKDKQHITHDEEIHNTEVDKHPVLSVSHNAFGAEIQTISVVNDVLMSAVIDEMDDDAKREGYEDKETPLEEGHKDMMFINDVMDEMGEIVTRGGPKTEDNEISFEGDKDLETNVVEKHIETKQYHEEHGVVNGGDTIGGDEFLVQGDDEINVNKF